MRGMLRVPHRTPYSYRLTMLLFDDASMGLRLRLSPSLMCWETMIMPLTDYSGTCERSIYSMTSDSVHMT